MCSLLHTGIRGSINGMETHYIQHEKEIQDPCMSVGKAFLTAFQDMEDNSECRPLLYNRYMKEVIQMKHPSLLTSR
jgi:hypothetical protein